MVLVLVAALATLPVGALPGRQIDLAPRREAQNSPLAEVEARTRAFERARAHHEALLASEVPEAFRAVRTLAQVQERVGEPEGWFKRLVPGGTTSALDVEGRRAAVAQLKAARADMQAARTQALARFDALEAQLQTSAHRDILLKRLEAQREAVRARATEADALALRTTEALEKHDGSFLGSLGKYFRDVGRNDAATHLAELRARLDAWAPPAAPILGAELTYVQGPQAVPPLPEGNVTPAFLSGGAVGPVLEDTTEGREVELTEEVRAKAQALGSPKAAYDFVKNEARLEWYAGSLKGSVQTLRDMRGNDADLSTLLVALLRAQGTPARYAVGSVLVSYESLAAAMGLLTEAEVQALEAVPRTAALPQATRERVLQVLTAAGVAYVPSPAGRSDVVQLARTWVEAYLPYGDYRGAGEGQGEKQWVPLEVGLTGRLKAAQTPPVLDAWEAMGSTAAAVTEAYLAEGTPAVSPRDFFKARVTAFLAGQHPDIFYSQTMYTVQPQAEALPYLPGTLPYSVVNVHGEYAFLPDDMKHRVHLTASDESGVLLEVTVPAHQLVGHRALWAYKPASDADAEAIRQAGGLYLAPAALVEVLPVLRVDGREVAVGTRPVGLGATHAWRLEVLAPGAAARHVDNRVLAGNFIALGVGAPGNAYRDTDAGASSLDGPAARFLYGRAAAYASAWTEAEEELARVLQVLPVRPSANFVFVQNQLRVDATFGVRQRLAWTGVDMDADLRTMTPVELKSGRAQALQRLAGYEGSYLEAKVLADGTGVRALSSTSLLQEARAQGVAVLRLTSDNQAQELARLTADEAVRRDVVDQLALGREVLIPARPLSVEAWVGTGYITHAPDTQEGGYFLAGRISGGQTVVSPSSEEWLEGVNPKLVEEMQQPDAPEAETDVSRVAMLVKVRDSDFQEMRVGDIAPRPLRVLALTAEGRPVKGAPVVFLRFGLAKPGIAVARATLDLALKSSSPLAAVRALPSEVRLTTNAYGEASVFFTPDPHVLDSSIQRLDAKLGPQPQLIGVNEVLVRVETGEATAVQVKEPFRLVGHPLEAADVLATATVGPTEGGVSATPLSVRVVDRFGNWLANQTVTWASSSPQARFIDVTKLPAGDVGATQWLSSEGNPSQVTSLTTRTPTSGEVLANYIPPMAAGTLTVTATSGGHPRAFAIPVTAGAEFVFRMSQRSDTLYNGITGTAFPEPVSGVVLRRVDGAWKPLTGLEADLEPVRITMTVRDGAGALVGEPISRLPADIDPPLVNDEQRRVLVEPPTPGDTKERVVFWPRYALDNDVQHMAFTATVSKKGQAQTVCCGDSFVLNPVSARPRLSVAQRKPTEEEVPLASEPAVLAETKALVLSIQHPSDFPVYLRVTQEPAATGENVVDIPGPEAVARYQDEAGVNPSLIKVAPNLAVARDPTGALSFWTYRIRFPLSAGTHGGRFLVEVVAPEKQGDKPERFVTVASRAVTVTAEPLIHLIGDDALAMNTEADQSLYIVGVQEESKPAERIRTFKVTLSPKPTDGSSYGFSIASVGADDMEVDRVQGVLTKENGYMSAPITAIGARQVLVPDDLPVSVGGEKTSTPTRTGSFKRVIVPDPKPYVLRVTQRPKAFRLAQWLMDVDPTPATPEVVAVKVLPLRIRAVLGETVVEQRNGKDYLRVINPARLCLGDDHSYFTAEGFDKGPAANGVYDYMLRWTLSDPDLADLKENRGRRAKVVPNATREGSLWLAVAVREPALATKSKSSSTELEVKVKEYRSVTVKPYIIRRDDGTEPAVTYAPDPADTKKLHSSVIDDIEYANMLWRQACVRFSLMPEAADTYIDNTTALLERKGMALVAWSWPSGSDGKRGDTVLDPDHIGFWDHSYERNYIELYYRQAFPTSSQGETGWVQGQTTIDGAVILCAGNSRATEPERQAGCSRERQQRVVAHELGHAIGLATSNVQASPIKEPPYVEDDRGAHAADSYDGKTGQSLMDPESDGVDISEEEAAHATETCTCAH